MITQFKQVQSVFKRMFLIIVFQLQKSSNVVIIGGGAVGVELVGEIAETFPDKHVTLVHSGDHLVTTEFGEKFVSQIESAIAYYSSRVTVIKGTYTNTYSSCGSSSLVSNFLTVNFGYRCQNIKLVTGEMQQACGTDSHDRKGHGDPG